MRQYLDLVEKILKEGEWKNNRTCIKAKTISGAMFEHDMSNGFPLLTTKQMSLKNIAVELEFFIKGLRDKKWLQERGCHIWDEWANPQIVKETQNNQIYEFPWDWKHDEKSYKDLYRAEQKLENDLGRIYGVQWRDWRGMMHEHFQDVQYKLATIQKIDQLKNIVEKITPGNSNYNPYDRRLVVSAWQPAELDQMALPPCHLLWQIIVIDNKINLNWYQRSVDTMLGLPYNIASYGLLLLLLAKQSGLKPGKLCGMLGDIHIYENHINKAEEQVARAPFILPKVEIINFKSIFNWEYSNFELKNYSHHSSIKFDIAI